MNSVLWCGLVTLQLLAMAVTAKDGQDDEVAQAKMNYGEYDPRDDYRASWSDSIIASAGVNVYSSYLVLVLTVLGSVVERYTLR